MSNSYSLHEEKFKIGDIVSCDEEGVRMAIVVSSECRMDGGRRYNCRILDYEKRRLVLHSDNFHLMHVDLPPDMEKLMRILYQ